jgi:hypothetical protein
VRVKSNVRAAGGSINHNQTVKGLPGKSAGRRGIFLLPGLLVAVSLLFVIPQAEPTRTAGLFSVSAFASARQAEAPQSAPVSWTLTTLDFPDFASVNAPIDINTHGDIVGYYNDRSGAFHGYLKLKDGPFIPIDFPSATTTITTTISDNRDIVGVYFDREGFQHGFRLSNGVYTTIDVPGAAQTRGVGFEFGPGLGTAAFGINSQGDIVGEYADED